MGKANKRLMYVDQVLQLVYDEGSPCPSKFNLRYKSVISFVCRPEAGPTNRPMLISLEKQTCTLFFSWHTPLACEQLVSVEPGTCGIGERRARGRGAPRFPHQFCCGSLGPPEVASVSDPSTMAPVIVIIGSKCPVSCNQAVGTLITLCAAFWWWCSDCKFLWVV